MPLSILLNLYPPEFIIIFRGLYKVKSPTAQALDIPSKHRSVLYCYMLASHHTWESQCAISQDIWMIKMDSKCEAARSDLQCHNDLNSNLSSAIYKFQDFIQIF